MTDTTAPATTWWVDLLKAYSPSLGQCFVIVVTFATAIGTTLLTQQATAPYKLDAADRPRPTPIVSLSDVDRSLEIHCGEVRGTLATILARLPVPTPARAPSR
jgi:hypothetical protein